MKAYVLIVKRRRYQDPTVRVCWSNTECSDRIIGLANNLRKSPCEPSFKLGDALNTLDNLGFDVHTYPVDCDPPPSLEDALFEYSKTWFCGDCGADISEAQANLSKARWEGAPAECKDCCTRKLTVIKEAELEQVGFEVCLEGFLNSIRELLAAHYTKNLPRLAIPTISVDPGGQKYARIVRDDGSSCSVFCFVDKSNGDILKAYGWKRPAKHARGSIYENAGKRAITPYGVHYITSRGHRN